LRTPALAARVQWRLARARWWQQPLPPRQPSRYHGCRQLLWQGLPLQQVRVRVQVLVLVLALRVWVLPPRVWEQRLLAPLVAAPLPPLLPQQRRHPGARR